MTKQQALDELISRAGGVTRLAEALHLSNHAVWRWVRKGHMPAKPAYFSYAQSLGLPPHIMRPDLDVITTKPPALAALESLVSKAGGLGKLASQFGVTRDAVHRWMRRGYMPAKPKYLDRARAYGFTPKTIRPDLAAMFGQESTQ